MHWRIFVIIYVSKYYHIKLNDFVLHPFPFPLCWFPKWLINFHSCTEHIAHKLSSIRFRTLSSKLLSTGASGYRFNYIMAEGSKEAWLCPYLACDYSKANCAINWDERLRGLLLICLHNAVGLCVHFTRYSIRLILWIPPQEQPSSFSVWQYLESLICRWTVVSLRTFTGTCNYVAQVWREKK